MGLPFIEGSKTVQSRAKKTLQKTLKRSAYLLWRGPTLDDFKMTFDFRIVGGNSRGHFRSRETAKWQADGYQAVAQPAACAGPAAAVPLVMRRLHSGWDLAVNDASFNLSWVIYPHLKQRNATQDDRIPRKNV